MWQLGHSPQGLQIPKRHSKPIQAVKHVQGSLKSLIGPMYPSTQTMRTVQTKPIQTPNPAAVGLGAPLQSQRAARLSPRPQQARAAGEADAAYGPGGAAKGGPGGRARGADGVVGGEAPAAPRRPKSASQRPASPS